MTTQKAPPKNLDDDGLLLAWSLEHEHQRLPIGFNYGEQTNQSNSPSSDFLDPVILESGGHVATIAPTGTGKGVSCVIPNLLHYSGQAVIIDPKGENYAVTAKHRKAMGHKVVVIDPFNVTDAVNKDCLNPLDLIAIDKDAMPSLLDECSALTALLVEETNIKDPFWDQAAHRVIAALIGVVAIGSNEERHLDKVADLLNQSEKKLRELFFVLNKQTNNMFNGYSSILDTVANNTISGIVTTAKQHLQHIQKGAVGDSISNTSFSLLDFISGKPMTIYLVLPPDKLYTHRKLLRLWIGTLIRLILKRPGAPAKPTLMMLDEAAQLGHLSELVQSVTLLRGYGMQVWTFWQDINQLKQLYPDNWQTLLNNCKAIQAFGFPNKLACDEISNITGYNQITNLLDLDRDEMLLQLAGDEAVIAQKPNYLQDNTFVGKFNNNPFHSKIDAKGFVPIHPQRIYKRPSKNAPEVSASFDINNLTIDGMHQKYNKDYEKLRKVFSNEKKSNKEEKITTDSAQED
ncbi:type IV secretory system conjugative DNA transfer family protein [Thalassotalea sp. G2M2-11]|uniref:type IV secretory system conjugative DNA transfer family protein n=1 Tax=Thalassotalea sp. G2M2-11 TaxID=2787627 RepID=UPI0019D0F168|nr:type IV secretory system conjugative DNA transfer family protein [Thalassotalea sp. G2M2-11]